MREGVLLTGKRMKEMIKKEKGKVTLRQKDCERQNEEISHLPVIF